MSVQRYDCDCYGVIARVGDQGDYLLYAKGGTTDVLWEGNVFGPSADSGWGNVPVETGHLVNSDPTSYESERFVVRNNLFVGLQGTAAFAFAGPRVALLYNNVFYENGGVKRAMIALSRNAALAGGPALGVYSLNNIFFQLIRDRTTCTFVLSNSQSDCTSINRC